MPTFKIRFFTSFDLFCKLIAPLISSFRFSQSVPLAERTTFREKKNLGTGFPAEGIFMSRQWSFLQARIAGSEESGFAVQVCNELDAGLAGQTCHVPMSRC
jgi:hypothetical protein